MAYSLEPKLGVSLSTTTTSPVATLGEVVEASDGNFYMYVQANGALAASGAAVVASGYQAAPLTTTSAGAEPQSVVVPQVAFADNEYGWAVCKGSGFTVLAINSAASVKMYTTATDGVLDDATGSGQVLVAGLTLQASAGGTATATAANAATFMSVN